MMRWDDNDNAIEVEENYEADEVNDNDSAIEVDANKGDANLDCTSPNVPSPESIEMNCSRLWLLPSLSSSWMQELQ